MSVDNQIDIPQSFMAMYLTPGRSRPNAPQEVVLARYEQCEDMACVLTEHAQTLAFKENFAPREVLQRCHQGLLASGTEGAGFSAAEAFWVVSRLAELLEWPLPAPAEVGAGGTATDSSGA